MSHTTAEEKAAVLAPLTPAANDQRFVVRVTRNGSSVERTVWAPDSFSAWMDAFDAHGPLCKIEVKRA